MFVACYMPDYAQTLIIISEWTWWSAEMSLLESYMGYTQIVIFKYTTAVVPWGMFPKYLHYVLTPHSYRDIDIDF